MCDNDINSTINGQSSIKDTNILSNIKNIKQNENNSLKILAAGESDRPNKLSQNEVLTASASVNRYISSYGVLPNYVTISDYKYSMPEFMYILGKTIQYKHKKSNAQITVKSYVNDPVKPQGTSIKGKISLKNYYDYTTRVVNYISKHNIAPNYVSTTLGKMQYQTTIFSFIKILNGMKGNNLPSSLSISVQKTNKINKYIPRYTDQVASKSKALNDAYQNEDLGPYLDATKNCQVNDNSIQYLSNEITKSCTTTRQKAVAIFNWVRDKVSYVFYYNTKNGAKKTLSKRSGNCVDQAHLLIALCRASDIPARYVNGQCKFISGSTYGHVWAQVLVDDVWTISDTTSSKNSFGIINNWNSYKIYGKYDGINF